MPSAPPCCLRRTTIPGWAGWSPPRPALSKGPPPKMQANGEDLRFTEVDGTTDLLHWTDLGTINSATTEIWVRVPSIPTGTPPTGGTTIYMYYGNPAALSASDGDATLEFFDDFEDGDISDWSQYGSGTVAWANDSGNGVLLKRSSNDPHGGYSLFNNGA